MYKFMCENCKRELGGMPPWERFKAFCPKCKKMATFNSKEET